MKKSILNSHYVVILADLVSNNFGTTFSKSVPVQFTDVFNKGKSLIQSTYEFYTNFIDKSNIYIVTSNELDYLAKSQIENLNRNNFIVLPENKNSASSIAYLSFKLFKLNNDANIIFSPSDISSEDELSLTNSIFQALEFTLENDALMVLGSKPSYYQSQLEYLSVQDKSVSSDIPVVKKLQDNPNLEYFIKHSDTKPLFLNSKVIIGKALEFIDMYREYAVQYFRIFHGIYAYLNTDKEKEALNFTFSDCKSTTFEFLFIENAKNIFLKEAELDVMNYETYENIWSLFNKQSRLSNNFIYKS
jgi:mannose-1-phosphate guanylyltransferase